MKNLNPKNVFLISFLFLCSTVFADINFAQTVPLLLDENFTTGVSGGTDNVKSISLQPDGKILVGGDFRLAAGVAHRSLAKFYANGSIDDSFNPALPAGAVVETIFVQPDGKILISGNFTVSVDARPIFGLIRLEPDGSFDKRFAANLAGSHLADEMALQFDGKIVGDGEAQKNSLN